MVSFDFILQTVPLGSVSEGGFSFLALFIRADWVVKAVMIVLVLASLWSWSIAIDKMINFILLKRRMRNFEDMFWSDRSLADMAASLSGQDGRDPLTRIFMAAMREWEASTASVQTLQMRIRQGMYTMINREMAQLESGMVILAIISSVSVFIGLFGTVWGIMNAFRAIAISQNTSLSIVAPGIAEALFATALGLMAAIPAAIFYNLFSAKLNSCEARFDNFVDEFMTLFARVSVTER